MATSSRGTSPRTVEEQRILLQKQLAVSPDDLYIKQALVRLTSPQHIKYAANSGVFVSYSRADDLFAIQLAEDLRTTGLKIWLDINSIMNDQDWGEAVHQALDACGLMIVILSPGALEDIDVKNEVDYFLAQGKIILPALHSPCNYSAMNLWNQPVDFRHDYTLGLNILVRLLSSQTGATRNSSFTG